MHVQFYLDWTKTFAGEEDIFPQRLFKALEIGYVRFPVRRKRGRGLLALA